MATKKQINANRQNAQKSTGPKTAEGKAAVSQNAVKHGLFAESVIKGENPADYEAFHDRMVAEMKPVGPTEILLAERIVSLWWRLERAERMQNQAIDEMIEHQIDNPLSKSIRTINLHAKGVKMGDPRYLINHLQLGRIATYDWSNCKVLDRMMLYERRIENSLHKTLRELERRQLIRQYQQQEAEQELPRREPNRPAEKNSDLKKQSQYVPGLMGANSLLEGDYDRNSPVGEEQNKPNQSQPQWDTPRGVPFQTLVALKTGRSVRCSSDI
jgi:hypothetical protein